MAGPEPEHNAGDTTRLVAAWSCARASSVCEAATKRKERPSSVVALSSSLVAGERQRRAAGGRAHILPMRVQSTHARFLPLDGEGNRGAKKSNRRLRDPSTWLTRNLGHIFFEGLCILSIHESRPPARTPVKIRPLFMDCRAIPSRRRGRRRPRICLSSAATREESGSRHYHLDVIPISSIFRSSVRPPDTMSRRSAH